MKTFNKKNPELDNYSAINTAYKIFKIFLTLAAISCLILGIAYGINKKSFLLNIVFWAGSAISITVLYFFGLLSFSLCHNMYWTRKNSEKILKSLQSIAERKTTEKSDNTSVNNSENV